MAESDYFFEIRHEQRNVVLCCRPAGALALALVVHFSHLDCLSVLFLIYFFPGGLRTVGSSPPLPSPGRQADDPCETAVMPRCRAKPGEHIH